MATAGRAVVTSGGTVAVGCWPWSCSPVPPAPASATPACSSAGGDPGHPDPAAGAAGHGRPPARLAGEPTGRGLQGRGSAASRLWTGWAAGVARRWLATLAALAVLVPLGVAALGLRLGEPPAARPRPVGPAREALDRLEGPGSAAASSPPSRCWSRPAPTGGRGRPPGQVRRVNWPSPRPGQPGSGTPPGWSASCRSPRPAATPGRRPWSASAT